MPERMKDNQFISSPDTGRSIPRLTSMTKKKKKKKGMFFTTITDSVLRYKI